MEDLNSAIQKINSVEGWLREQEKIFLYNHAKDHLPGNGVIVEIGSWKGKSTILMSLAIQEKEKITQGILRQELRYPLIFAIDPFGKPEGIEIKPQYNLWEQQGIYDHYEAFISNITQHKVNKFVIPIKDISERAINVYKEKYNYPIRMLFIDGCHDREFVQKDFDLWSPLVINGGVIAFHDAWDKNTDFKESAAIVAKNELIDSPNYHNGQCQSIIYGYKING